MIAVRRLEERRRERASERLSAPELSDLPGAVRLHDTWLRPGDRIELDGRNAYELITYVVSGTLVHTAGTQTTAVICAGELQRACVGMKHEPAQSQTNPSLVEASHVVQLVLHNPQLELAGRPEQRRFSLAQRRGLLCAVAGPDGAANSLTVQSAMVLYSTVLEPGQHIVHGLAAAHSGLLHVVSGELSVVGYVLGPGDTAHARDERSLAFTAREHAEVLLGDLSALSSF